MKNYKKGEENNIYQLRFPQKEVRNFIYKIYLFFFLSPVKLRPGFEVV